MTIDSANSKAAFSLKKLGFITVAGTLSNFSGKIVFDPTALDKASFDVCVSSASITTGNPKRDEHLKNADFFDVEKFPNICFQSSSVKAVNDQFETSGILTILDQPQAVSIPFHQNGNTLTGTFKIDRSQFGLGNKFPGFIVGKMIAITIICQLQ
ncbi:MAG: YceI family protein [Bacteroidota bacterium]